MRAKKPFIACFARESPSGAGGSSAPGSVGFTGSVAFFGFQKPIIAIAGFAGAASPFAAFFSSSFAFVSSSFAAFFASRGSSFRMRSVIFCSSASAGFSGAFSGWRLTAMSSSGFSCSESAIACIPSPFSVRNMLPLPPRSFFSRSTCRP